MFLNYYLEGRDEELYFANGGGMTLSSYGLTLADARAGTGFPEDHLRFLTSLPLYHETEEYLFVHAGLRPGIPLSGQSPEDLLWIRDEFIDSDWDFGKTVVFGHTPLRKPLLQSKQDRHRHGVGLRGTPDLHRAPLPNGFSGMKEGEPLLYFHRGIHTGHPISRGNRRGGKRQIPSRRGESVLTPAAKRVRRCPLPAGLPL